MLPVSNMPPLIFSTPQQKLLTALDAEITRCRNESPTDEGEKDRRTLELKTLTTHLLWARRVGDNQRELDLIVRALERLSNRGILRSNRNWRKAAGA
jgi:hypothetical protein